MIEPFFPACATCASWSGDLCEFASDFCIDGDEWQPSAAFLAAHPEAKAVLARDAMLCGLLRKARAEQECLRISQLRRTAGIALGFARRWEKSLDALDPDDAARIARNAARYRRFAAACLAEIERLRGME